MEMSRTASPAGVVKRTKVRYAILLLIFLITTFNYADRATLSVTGSAMRAEFGLDAIRLGYIFSAFSWAYVLSQLPAGWLLDRFGARRVYAASIFLWSLFTLLQSSIGLLGSAAAAITALFVLRFAMGAAESPAFPANAKVVASWFPTVERGTASAIFNSAQYFAAVVFTPLMAWLTHAFGWHTVYLAMGDDRTPARPHLAEGDEEPRRPPARLARRTRLHRTGRRRGERAQASAAQRHREQPAAGFSCASC